MTTINSTTKRGQHFINAFINNSADTRLQDVYTKFSAAKERAYNHCYDLFAADPTADMFCIICHNTFGFTVAWWTPAGLRVETPQNSYFIPLE